MALRVGVIGAGWVATARHLPAYRRYPNVATVTVFDRLAARSRGAAQITGATAWKGSLAQFLDQSFDVVSICTSPWTHAEFTIAALEHGSHVFVEKPMAMNANDASMMVAAATSNGRLLCVSHNFLFSAAAQQADRLLHSAGVIQYGLATQFSSDRRRLPEWYRALPGGLLFDELPHMLYTMRHYIGDLSLEGLRATKMDDGHPDVVEIQVRGDGINGQILAVFSSPASEWHLGLVGSEGVIDVDLFRDFAFLVGPDGEHTATDILRTSLQASVGHWKGFVSSGTRLARRRASWGHHHLIHRFLGAIALGAPAPVPVADSLNVVRLTDQVLAEFGV